MRPARAWLLAGLLVASSAAAAQTLSSHARQACVDLVLDYAYYRDRPDAQAVAALFTQDAVLQVRGEIFAGREAIYQRLLAAPQSQQFRHMMSTIRIFADGADRARGVSYVTVYVGVRDDEAADVAAGPLAVDGFTLVGEYHDDFVRTDEGWKISRRELVPVFVPAAQD